MPGRSPTPFRRLLLLLLPALGCGITTAGLRNETPFSSVSLPPAATPAAVATGSLCARATNCALAPPTEPGCLAYACAPGTVGHGLPWCNASLPFGERAADLAARVPLANAGALLQTDGAAVPAEGLPVYLYGEEGLHGVRCPAPPPAAGVPFVPNGTTTFPEPIATAASFNDSLFESIGSAISDEFRAFSNLRCVLALPCPGGATLPWGRSHLATDLRGGFGPTGGCAHVSLPAVPGLLRLRIVGACFSRLTTCWAPPGAVAARSPSSHRT